MLLDRQMTRRLVDNLKEHSPALVEELIPDVLKIGDIQKVLKRLLRERVPVRDLTSILECLADQSSQTKNTDVLTEYCRATLSETITGQFKSEDNTIQVVVLASQLESHLIGQAQQGVLNSNTLGFTPETVEEIYTTASGILEKMIRQGLEPAVLTSPVLRPTIYDFLVPILPEVSVLSYNDVSPDVQIKTFDRIQLKQKELQEPSSV